MSTPMNSRLSLSKFGELLFARQTPQVAAEKHRDMVETFKSWRERRAAERELSRLSERELADIGLTRQGIPEAVKMRRRLG